MSKGRSTFSKRGRVNDSAWKKGRSLEKKKVRQIFFEQCQAGADKINFFISHFRTFRVGTDTSPR
jgi:hypothetical protein